MAPDEADDDVTSWTVCVDTQNSPVQNALVYVSKLVVVQTARYPPQALMNERVTGRSCKPVPQLKNRQHQSMDDGRAQDDDEHMDAADESDDHIEYWTKIVPQDDCERELEQRDDKAGADTCTDNYEKARTARCSSAQKNITKMMFC
ncbi:hypothetical protein VPH35_074053 [Triticum aestivum]